MTTNQDLITACINGDRKAQHSLYKYYASKLFSVAWRYMKKKEDAEDVLQEAFIKIFKNLEGFKADSSLETWMRRITINCALNHQRGKLYMFPMLDITDLNEYDEPLAFDNFQEEEIMSLVNELPEGSRIVFNLYCIEGYKHREIAEMLKINEGTSKSQLARAKKILMEAIEALSDKRQLK